MSSRAHRTTAAAAAALAAALVWGLAGCDSKSAEPRIETPWVPAPATPEKIVEAIEAIYNDTEHSAAERLDEYRNLFADDFIFRCQPADYDQIGRENWGLADEIAAHERMFEALEDKSLLSLQVDIAYLPAVDVENPPGGDREGWQTIFATNVYIRLMENQNDGFEVNGGQAEFYFEPAPDGSRWYLAEWDDLPRRFAPGDRGASSAVESWTWGKLKAIFF